MSAPEPTHPLAACRHPGVGLPRRDIVQVMVRRGRDEAFAAAMARGFGMAPPATCRSATGAVTAIWIQPGAFLLTSPESGLAARTAAVFDAIAAVEDQSHGRTTLTIAGSAARDILARGCRIDLHPRVFGPGCAVTTPIAQIGCLLHQTDDAPTFELTVAATLAEPFFHWLVEAGL